MTSEELAELRAAVTNLETEHAGLRAELQRTSGPGQQPAIDALRSTVGTLQATVKALEAECAELRDELRWQTASANSDSNLDPVLYRVPTGPKERYAAGRFPPRRPFDIWYDPVQEKWKIYLPDGCVTVGNAEAEYKDAKQDDVATITAAETVYCHVREIDNRPGSYEYEFTDKSESDDAVYVFPVAKFAEDASEVTALLAGTLRRFEGAKKKAYLVTNVRQTMDKEHGLVLHVTKAPVLVDKPSGSESKSEMSLSESSSSTTVATLTEVTVVTKSIYNPNSHQFYNRKRTMGVLADTADDSTSTSASVFTAVPVCKNIS